MLKPIHRNTAIGLVLLMTAVFFLFSDVPYVSSVCSLLAFFFAISETAKYTSWFQFLVLFFSAVFLGISAEFSLFEEMAGSMQWFPMTGISVVLAVLVNIFRLLFFKQFGYSRFKFFELFLMVFSAGFFIAGNVLHPSGWEKWIFPLPVILWGLYIAYGVLRDAKGLLSFTKKNKYVEPGFPAPEFSLPDQEGKVVNLSDFKNERNLLLIFVRGDWCPGCHIMLRTYQRENHRFKEKNILCMAIGPDPVGVNRAMVEKLGLDFKVLSDGGQKTAQTYGCRLNDYENLHPLKEAHKFKEGIPLPASFLVDKNGIVRYASRPDRVGEFLDPTKIFPVLEQLI